jgi:hypothetical protein
MLLQLSGDALHLLNEPFGFAHRLERPVYEQYLRPINRLDPTQLTRSEETCLSTPTVFLSAFFPGTHSFDVQPSEAFSRAVVP